MTAREAIAVDPILSPSIDASPIEASLGGHRLSIPRNWIQSAFKGSYDVLYLHLATTFPELAGGTAETLGHFQASKTERDRKIVWIGRVAYGSLAQWRARPWIEVSEDEAASLAAAPPGQGVRLKTDDALVIGYNDHDGAIGWSDLIEVAPGALFMCRYGAPLLGRWRDIHDALSEKLSGFLVR
jgi:hypothetical protein